MSCIYINSLSHSGRDPRPPPAWRWANCQDLVVGEGRCSPPKQPIEVCMLTHNKLKAPRVEEIREGNFSKKTKTYPNQQQQQQLLLLRHQSPGHNILRMKRTSKASSTGRSVGMSHSTYTYYTSKIKYTNKSDFPQPAIRRRGL